MSGKFIVIEGADGVGSSTQCSLLCEHIKNLGMPVHLTAEPSTGVLGVLAREILKKDKVFNPDALALLFAADRIDHYAREIKPKLESGVNVVSDRYTLSSYVYQSLSSNIDWIKQINAQAPRPDATIIISIPAEKAWQRINARIANGKAPRELFDERGLQAMVHNKYTEYADLVDGVVVSGDADKKQVLQTVVSNLERSGIISGTTKV